MRSARALAGAVLFVLLAALGLSEFHAAQQRDLAGEGPVQADVATARDALARRLLDLEASCARTAEQALRAAGDETEPSALFAALAGLRLPAGAGVRLLDRDDRLLAWSGGTLRDGALRDLPTTQDGGILVESASARHMAVPRRRTSPVDGVAVVAVAYRPFEVRYPARTPFLRSRSLTEEIAQEFRVASVAILPAATLHGVLLPSAFGGDLARIVVDPISPDVWREAVDAEAATRRAALVAALAALAAVLAFAAAGRIRGAARRWVVRGVAALALRLVLTAVPLAALFPSDVASPATYGGGWPLGLNESPIALLLSTLALASGIGCFAAAAAGSRRRPLPLPAFVAAAAIVAIAGRLGLSALIDDVVWNSTTRFFPDDTVLPPPGPAALLVALVASAFAVVAALDGLGRLAAPPGPTSVSRRIAAAFVAAAVVIPLGDADAPLRWGPAIVGVLGGATAMMAVTIGRGIATRAAVIPLGLAVAVLAPLQRGLDASLRADLADVAQERAEEDEGDAQRADILFVERVLDGIVGDPDLRSAIGGLRLPGDLAARLWAASPLSSRVAASGLEILPFEATLQEQRFGADLPPNTWMPDPTRFPGPRTRWVDAAEGRGPWRDSRWVVGETPIDVDGGVPVSVRVWLETRVPRTKRLLAQHADAARPSARSRTLRSPTMDRYDLFGYAEADLAENPFIPLGLLLDDQVREEVITRGHALWRDVSVSARTYLVYVIPSRDDEGTVDGARAFSTLSAGAGDILLRGTKSALCGALLAVVALLLTAPWWARGAQLRLAHRIVLSYVVVSAVPLLFLAWANGELVRQRDLDDRLRRLREAVTVFAAAVQDPMVTGRLAEIDPGDLERMESAVIGIPDPAYHPGRRGNVYLRARLVYSTDQGLLGTDLLPTRMPGRAFHEVVLLRRSFHVETARAGDYAVNVGYAPLRNPDSPRNEVIGAVSVTMVHEGQVRDAEQAAATTAVLGFYLASLVTVMAVGSVVAERLTSPLRALRLATHRVASGDLSEPVRGEGPGELGQVVAAFNSMLHDLAESREKLVRAEKEAAWRDMARQVAHEVKNPLTPMRLAAEHLRRAHDDNSPQFPSILRRSVDVIVRQTENLRRIVTDFRDFARLPVQRREPVDLSAALREVLDLYVGVPGLDVQVDVVEPAPPVLADPDEMRRVLVNLAGNAVEALDGSAGTLSGRVTLDGAHLVVTIADDGPGIDADALPHLYEPSFSTKTGGTGLGLAICKRAIDDLGGSIDVASTPGAGTTVTVRLPIAPV